LGQATARATARGIPPAAAAASGVTALAEASGTISAHIRVRGGTRCRVATSGIGSDAVSAGCGTSLGVAAPGASGAITTRAIAAASGLTAQSIPSGGGAAGGVAANGVAGETVTAEAAFAAGTGAAFAARTSHGQALAGVAVRVDTAKVTHN
jgi:hypothetical protein